MSVRRSRRAPAHYTTLVFVTRYPAGRAPFFRSEFGQLLAGARALAQGYRVEKFTVHDPALSTARSTVILLRRGVRGVIVAPRHTIHEPVELDWAQFSAVAIGYSLRGVPLSRISHHPFHGLTLAAGECPAAGRPRLGLILPRRVHEKVQKRWLAALLLDQAEHPGPTVPPRRLDGWTEAEFAAWFDRHRPDAVLCINASVLQDWLRRLGPAAHEVALVSLDWPPPGTAASPASHRTTRTSARPRSTPGSACCTATNRGRRPNP